MDGATGKPFVDLGSLLTGNGRILAFVCRDDNEMARRTFHFRYEGNVCDFCVIHGVEWRYFYSTLDCGIPMKYSETIDRWLLTRISEDTLFPLNECDYFDSLLVNGLN